MSRTGQGDNSNRNRPSPVTAVAVGVVVGAFLLPDDARVWARAGLYTLAAVTGTLNLRTARRAGGPRVPEFWLLTSSCGLFAVSNFGRALVPDGAVGELVNTAAALVLIAAGVVFVRRIRSGHWVQVVLDGLLVGTTSAVVIREAIVALGTPVGVGSASSVLLIAGLVGVSIWLRAIATDPSMAVRAFAVAAGLAISGNVLVVVLQLPAARPLMVDAFTLISAVVLVYGLAHPGLSDRISADTPAYRPITVGSIAMMLVAVAAAPATVWARVLTGRQPDGTLATGLTLLTLLCVARFAIMLQTRDRHRERLNQQIRTDPLTGVASRRLLMEQLDARIARTRDTICAEDERWAVLVIDLDDFKAINDRFGHAAGDALLIAVAERLQESVGGRGLVARLAGDEFAIITDDEGIAVLRDVRTSLARDIDLDGRDGPGVRASVGMAVAWLDEASAETVLERADQSMYAEKRRHHGQSRRGDDRIDEEIVGTRTS